MAEHTPNQKEVREALKAAWESTADLSAQLSDEEWEIETDCPGWSVRDNLIHILGTEMILLGKAIPDVDVPDLAFVKNDIGKMNQQWIKSREELSPVEILEEFRETTAERLNFLENQTPEDWNAVGPTPIGEAPYSRFMQIRAMDCWMHEQDMREALKKDGHREGVALKVALDEMLNILGYVVGKKGEAPENCAVEFDLTGPEARNVIIQMKDSRGTVVDSLESGGTPDIKFETDTFTMTRLLGGRKDGNAALGAGGISITCSAEHETTAKKILENLGYMI